MSKITPEQPISPMPSLDMKKALRAEQRLHALLQIPKTPQFSPDGKNSKSGLQAQKPRNIRK